MRMLTLTDVFDMTILLTGFLSIGGKQNIRRAEAIARSLRTLPVRDYHGKSYVEHITTYLENYDYNGSLKSTLPSWKINLIDGKPIYSNKRY